VAARLPLHREGQCHRNDEEIKGCVVARGQAQQCRESSKPKQHPTPPAARLCRTVDGHSKREEACHSPGGRVIGGDEVNAHGEPGGCHPQRHGSANPRRAQSRDASDETNCDKDIDTAHDKNGAFNVLPHKKVVEAVVALGVVPSVIARRGNDGLGIHLPASSGSVLLLDEALHGERAHPTWHLDLFLAVNNPQRAALPHRTRAPDAAQVIVVVGARCHGARKSPSQAHDEGCHHTEDEDAC